MTSLGKMTTIIKIQTTDESKLFLLSQHESLKRLSINLINIKKNEAYSGDLNELEMRQMAARVRMTYSDFLKDIEQSIIIGNTDNSSYLYSLENCSDNYLFKLQKKLDMEDTIVNLCSIKVAKMSYNVLAESMFQLSSEEFHKLNDDVQNLKTLLKESEKSRDYALDQLSIASKIKEDLEREMYAKFVCVLNKKKQKIRELKEQIQSSGIVNQNINTGRSRVLPKIRVSPSPDVSDIDADMDDINKPGPSISKKHTLLFFDDTETGISIKHGRVRKRRSKEKLVNNLSNGLCTSKKVEESKKSDNESDSELLANY